MVQSRPGSPASERTPSSLRRALQKRPLFVYFLIALGWTWTYVLLVQVYLRVPISLWTQLPVLFGPTLAGFIMTGVMEGKAGLRRFLHRFILWRVPVVWYLFVLIGIPIIYVAGCIVLGRGLSSYHAVGWDEWRSYPLTFLLVALVGGPLLEEPGWRGFALPRLQEKYGPLGGSLLLGCLWAAWHYPQYLVPAWAAQNGGLNFASVGVFTLSVVTFTLILTWLFNNTKGSLLLAILLHTSINTFSIYVAKLFPDQSQTQWNGLIGFGATALLILALTRGRLGYDKRINEKIYREEK